MNLHRDVPVLSSLLEQADSCLARSLRVCYFQITAQLIVHKSLRLTVLFVAPGPYMFLALVDTCNYAQMLERRGRKDGVLAPVWFCSSNKNTEWKLSFSI